MVILKNLFTYLYYEKLLLDLRLIHIITRNLNIIFVNEIEE